MHDKIERLKQMFAALRRDEQPSKGGQMKKPPRELHTQGGSLFETRAMKTRGVIIDNSRRSLKPP